MRCLATLVLSLCLAAPAAFAGGLGDMTDAERAAFREEVKAYLLENPDVIVEAMDVLQARQDAEAADRDVQLLQANAPAIFNSPSDWVGGNPDGDITVVEFMDYRCGYCRKAHEEVNELVTSDGNIRYILKEFPILGPESLLTSQFAIAIRMLYGDDAYKTAHDALITLRGDATAETLARLATDLGHDPNAVMAKMTAPDIQAVIDTNHALASGMDISGTPTFVIDQTMLRGYVPLDGMRQIVAEQRAG
jgi:protein-disulfide isomerase